VTSTDVGTRLREYAVLKAMGFNGAAVYATALAQIVLLSLLAFAPATAISLWLFHAVRGLTHLPLEMTPQLLGQVLALTLGMNLLAGVVTLSRLSRAQPAELF
jgi:putative ABC transport system permease protein